VQGIEQRNAGQICTTTEISLGNIEESLTVRQKPLGFYSDAKQSGRWAHKKNPGQTEVEATRTGLEPATTGSTVQYSNQLSYRAKKSMLRYRLNSEPKFSETSHSPQEGVLILFVNYSQFLRLHRQLKEIPDFA
jgi:hypothetical protein